MADRATSGAQCRAEMGPAEMGPAEMGPAEIGPPRMGTAQTGADVPDELIMVGVDGSPASVAALRWAVTEARLRGMRLHIVHVRHRTAAAPGHYVPLGANRRPPGRAEAESALRALVEEVLGPEASPLVQLELAEGLPARVLLDRAAGAAMLVLGSTRPGGPDAAPVGNPRAPLGPVARDCLRGAPCPVVIVACPSVPPGAELAHAT